MAQMTIATSPRYQDLLQRLVRLAGRDGTSGLLHLNQTITEQVLAMESSPREGRGAMLEQVRWTIARGLGLSEAEVSALGS